MPDHGVADAADGASDKGVPERRWLRLRIVVEAVSGLMSHLPVKFLLKYINRR